MRLTPCTVCVWCTHAAHKPCTHAHARARRFFVLWRAADGGDAYLAYYVDVTASSRPGMSGTVGQPPVATRMFSVV